MVEIEISKPGASPNVFVTGLDKKLDVIEALDESLSYYVANYERMPKFQSGQWDGKEHLFKRSRNGSYYFPFGLMKKVEQILQVFGEKYTKIGFNTCDIPTPDTVGAFHLRDYQIDALNALKRQPLMSGVLALPTAAGKTVTALAWCEQVRKFDERVKNVLILVHRMELMKQWGEEIKEKTGCNATLIGGSKKVTGDGVYTVAMIQTLYREKQREPVGEWGLIGDITVFDECFTYETTVITDKGILKIGDIVESQIECSVLTHTGEFKRVLNWFKKDTPCVMVRVIFDMGDVICTLNHRFMTNSGWVEAKNLSVGDVIYYSDETHKRATEPSIKNTMEQNITGREGRTKPGDVGEEKWTSETYIANGYTATINSGEFNGGYVNILSKSSEQLPKNCDTTFFKAVSVCGLEIFTPKRLVQKPPKTGNKWWLWGYELLFYQSVSSVFGGYIQSCKKRWENIHIRGLVKSDNGPDCTDRVVSGRWWKNTERGLCDITWKNIIRGGWLCSKLVISPMGNIIKMLSLSKRIQNTDNEGRGCYENDRDFERISVHPTDNGIQSFVYDLEVEDNHSYTANGVVVHNCHTMPSKTAYSVGMSIKSIYRLGLSATPNRPDGADMKLWGVAGCIAKIIDVEGLVDSGYIAEPIFELMYPDPVSGLKPWSGWADVYKRGITANVQRNDMIVMKTEDLLKQGRQVYIHVNHIAHGRALAGRIPGAKFLCGSDDKKDREQIISDFKSGELTVLVSTLLKEGVSIDGISALIYAAGGKSDIATIQTIGRALRMDETFGNALIFDFVDNGHKFLTEHSEERIRIYREIYGELFPY